MFQRKPILVLLLGCAAALVHAIHFSHVCDDAFISFQYARNFARGFGLSFSPGELTMGYSDLLWVLLLAGLDRVGLEPILAAKLLGTACAWGTLALVYRHLRARHRSLLPVVVGVGALAANGTFALWMFGGLEGHLFALLLVYAVVTTLDLLDRERERERGASGARDWAKVGVSLGLACMTRPEGFLFAVPVCLVVLLRGGGQRSYSSASCQRWRMPGLVALIAAATTLGVILWQWRHYGAPLPNTYYAKNLPLSWPVVQRGLFLTRDFVYAYYGLPLFILGGWVGFGDKTRLGRGWLPLLMIAAFVVFYLRIGGDALVYYRMWLPTLPMFALLAAEVVASLGEMASGPRALVVAGVVAAGFVFLGLPVSLTGGDIAHLRHDDANLQRLKVAATQLKALPHDTLVAANIVGIPAFYSELRILDMLGLNDATIARSPKKLGVPAHESHDGAYVLSRRPDIIIPSFPVVYEGPPSLAHLLSEGYPSDRDLYADRSFLATYSFVTLPVHGLGFLAVFVRKTSPVLADLRRAFPP